MAVGRALGAALDAGSSLLLSVGRSELLVALGALLLACPAVTPGRAAGQCCLDDLRSLVCCELAAGGLLIAGLPVDRPLAFPPDGSSSGDPGGVWSGPLGRSLGEPGGALAVGKRVWSLSLL